MTLLTSRKQQSTSVHALARGTPNDRILAWVRIDRQFGYESTGASGTNRLVLDTIDWRFGYESTGGLVTNRLGTKQPWVRNDWKPILWLWWTSSVYINTTLFSLFSVEHWYPMQSLPRLVSKLRGERWERKRETRVSQRSWWGPGRGLNVIVSLLLLTPFEEAIGSL